MSSGELLDADQLTRLFNHEFAVSDKTELIGGAAEPYYQPGGLIAFTSVPIMSVARFMRSLTGVSQARVAGNFPTMATGIALMVVMLSSSRLFLRSRRDLRRSSAIFVRRRVSRSRRVSIMLAPTLSPSSCAASTRVFRSGAISLSASICRLGPPGLSRRCDQ